MNTLNPDQTRTHRSSLFSTLLSALIALGALVLFFVPITEERFWNFDYILFLAFLLSTPLFLLPNNGKIFRIVIGVFTIAFLALPFVFEEYWTANYLLFLVIFAGIPIASFQKNRRFLRPMMLLFSLAYFGFLQASCPRIPGAIELILLHLFDDNTIIMHVIKVSVFVVMGLIFGRYFCGYICPKGIIQEYILSLRIRVKVPEKLDRILKYFKYLMLVLLIAFPLIELPEYGKIRFFRLIGPFKVIFNLSGETYLIIFLILTLFFCAFVERAYCRYICPEGALLALAQLISPHKMRFETHSCSHCLRCVKACPVDAFVVENKCPVRIRSTECISCKECESVCKEGSLYYGLKGSPQPDGKSSEKERISQ